MASVNEPQFGRYRSRRRYRLLTRSLPRYSTMSVERDDLMVCRHGLMAAKLLQQYFPHVYTAHVAHQVVTPSMMLGVTYLFLGLAHYHLLWLDECHTEFFAPIDPIKEFLAWQEPNEDELDTLVNQSADMLSNPFPMFFGLSRDLECLCSGHSNDHVLLITLLMLLKDTKWKGAWCWRWDETWDPADLCESLASADMYERIAQLQCLPADTDLQQLCNYLDTQSISLDETDAPCVRWLGSIIRYAMRQMDNCFADYSPSMIVEDFGGFSEVDWESDPDNIAWHRRLQEEAVAVSTAYMDLDQAMQKQPLMIQRLAECLTTAATAIRSLPTIPRQEIPPSEIKGAIQRCFGLTLENSAMPTVTSDQDKRGRQLLRPWQRLQIRPRPLPLADIVQADSEPDAQISMWRDGTVLLTRRDNRRGWRCYPIRWADAVQTFAAVPTTSGLLPPNTVATGFVNGYPWFVLYVPPMQRTIQVQLQGALRTYTLQTPPLIWSARPSISRINDSYHIWALAETPQPNTSLDPNMILHEAPFPNCRSGQICWGNSSPPVMDSADAALAALELFLTGSLFNDHWIDRKSVEFPANLLLRYETLTPDIPYPLTDLVPLRGAFKLASLTNRPWR